ncbi:thymocyte selection-associated high mobility group box protein TOX isoform X1 [Pongo pygmaeus]|uniref:TOX isoform 1 n=3 Tax=Catarrhini TaxID=9526 RepID=H2PQD6_PONAB|nr:thymocyte selection-associated high mobility group box protein TOX isoform X2 [Pongo abelii]XP_010385097.1 thymocyte selection-associated high mobility group box protein TOX isoform X1 [Rhinopithecus roxellana]XP_054354252.1 thymocyte selection-associated high mobility group box protein TOX [Pongo pygmaeus]PNJ47655.1 TOX isoform 1 [Pongo abelii]
MDVRFYPPPAQPAAAPDAPCLGPSPCLDPYYCNKFDGENMYMSMTEPSQDYVPASQSYPGPSLESEDFNIPPITPPSLPDHSLVHLNEVESGYHSLCHPMNHNGLLPFHPQNMDLPEITVSNMLGQDGTLLSNSISVMPDIRNPEGTQYSSHPQMAAMRPRGQPADIRQQPGMMPHGQLTTINQSQLSAQLGLNMGGSNVPHNSPSPPGSKSATPSPSSSVHEDEGDDTSKINGGEKRPASDMGKKPKTPKKKKKKDPNEPQKPVSAYALFFRDTQAAIKGQNPNATFGEVSKIVASMWDGLGEEQKQVYKKKTEAAKKEYLKQLAAYRASLVSKSYSEPVDVKTSQPPQLINSKPSVFHGPSQAHSALYLSSHYHQQPGMNPHLTAMHPSLPRNIAPKPNNQMPVTVSIANMAVSPPPPLQISPPLHQHLNMQQHQPLTMQQPLGNQLPMQVQSALHSPTMQQGFTLQPDYQTIINPTSTAAQVVTQAMEYVRSGCRNPPPQPVDWSNDYCSSGGMQRDKALYLT